jgi:hypothetical protein
MAKKRSEIPGHATTWNAVMSKVHGNQKKPAQTENETNAPAAGNTINTVMHNNGDKKAHSI